MIDFLNRKKEKETLLIFFKEKFILKNEVEGKLREMVKSLLTLMSSSNFSIEYKRIQFLQPICCKQKREKKKKKVRSY